MKLLTVGDSFTYGEELADSGKYQITDGTGAKPSEFAWPSILGKLIGHTVTNLGLPASSNDRIFRIALDNSIKEKYDIVICGWSEFARLDITLNGNDFPVTINSRWLTDSSWLKEYFVNYYSDENSCQKFLSYLITLQNHFKYVGQKYLFLDMHGSRNFYKQYSHLVEQIDTTYFVGWPDEGMTVWMGDCPKAPMGHPLELGHQRIAEHINEHIRNLGWVS